MSIKSFEDYQVDHGQLFEAKAAFNAAVEMCKAHYESKKEEPVEIKEEKPKSKPKIKSKRGEEVNDRDKTTDSE